MSVRVVKAVFDHSRQRGSARNVLLALAEWADDSGMAYPSVASLAKKARVSESTAHAVIRQLVASGELVVDRNAGRHGVNVYRIQTEAMETGQGGPDSAPVQISHPVQTSAPEPSVPRLHVLATGVRDGQGPESAPLQKLHPSEVLDEAERLWIAERKRAGLTRWTDLGGLQRLRAQVKAALKAGASWADVERALRAHAPDPKANGWYANDWIAEVQHDRQERERRQQLERDRQAAERERNARAEASWRELEAKHPGKTRRQIAELELGQQRRTS